MIKQWMLHTSVALMLTQSASCQSKTYKEAKELQKNIETMSTPPTVATSTGGYYLKANINGKPWIAKKMIPDTDGSSIVDVVGFNGSDPSRDAIKFQVGLKDATGKKRILSDSRSIHYFDPRESEGMYIAMTGEIVTTQATDDWMEGTFYGTATDKTTGQKVEITDGYFRIPKVKRK